MHTHKIADRRAGKNRSEICVIVTAVKHTETTADRRDGKIQREAIFIQFLQFFSGGTIQWSKTTAIGPFWYRHAKKATLPLWTILDSALMTCREYHYRIISRKAGRSNLLICTFILICTLIKLIWRDHIKQDHQRWMSSTEIAKHTWSY